MEHKNINIVDTNLEPEFLTDFSENILSHIFESKSVPITNEMALQLNTDFKYILMREKLNIVKYLQEKWSWNDVYDVDYICLKINKEYNSISSIIKDILNIDHEYFNSKYFVIRLSNTALVVFQIIGKRMKDVLNFNNTSNTLIQNVKNDFEQEINKIIEKVKQDCEQLTFFVNEQNTKIQENIATQLNDITQSTNVITQNIKTEVFTKMNIIEQQNEKMQQVLVSELEKSHLEIEDVSQKNAVLVENTNNNVQAVRTEVNDMLNKLGELEKRCVLVENMMTEILSKLDTQRNDMQKNIDDNFRNLRNDVGTTIMTINEKLEELIMIAFPKGKDIVFVK